MRGSPGYPSTPPQRTPLTHQPCRAWHSDGNPLALQGFTPAVRTAPHHARTLPSSQAESQEQPCHPAPMVVPMRLQRRQQPNPPGRDYRSPTYRGACGRGCSPPRPPYPLSWLPEAGVAEVAWKAVGTKIAHPVVCPLAASSRRRRAPPAQPPRERPLREAERRR